MLGASGPSGFKTIRIDDDNPCKGCLISCTPIKSAVEGATGPKGAFVTPQALGNGTIVGGYLNRSEENATFSTALLKPEHEQCEPRLISCKPLSNQTPSDHCKLIVKKAEVAESAAFCPPKNPLQMVCDADPCQRLKKCRAVTEPAGRHLPCVNLQYGVTPVATQTDIAPNDAPDGNARIFVGCPNRFGCEYVFTFNDSLSGVHRAQRFVVTQDCQILNASDGTEVLGDSVQLGSEEVQDAACINGVFYILDNTTLYVDPFGANARSYTIAPPPNATVSTAFTGVGYTVLAADVKRNRILILAAAGPLVAFDLTSEEFSVPFAVAGASFTDAKVLGDFLLAVCILDNLPDLLIAFALDAGTQTTFELPTESFAFSDIQVGLTAHPTALKVYAIGTSASNDSLLLFAVDVDQCTAEITAEQVDQLEGPIDVSSTASSGYFQRLRPEYCDGVLYSIVPAGVDAQWTALNELQSFVYNAGTNCIEGNFDLIAPNNILVTLGLENVCGRGRLSFDFTFTSNQPILFEIIINDCTVFSNGGVSASEAGTIDYCLTEETGNTLLIRYIRTTNDALGNTQICDVTIDGKDITSTFMGDGSPAPNPLCSPPRLVVDCVNDSNPCALTRVDSVELCELVAPEDTTMPRFALTPSGCLFVAAGGGALTLTAPIDQRLLGKKCFVEDNPETFCRKVVEKSSSPACSTFCPLENPTTSFVEPDPCCQRVDCRVAQLPLGANLPCALTEVDGSVDLIPTLFPGFPADGGANYYFERGCNDNDCAGCEYHIIRVASTGIEAFYTRFFIDQNNNITLDCAPVPIAETLDEPRIRDIECYKNNAYALIDNNNFNDFLVVNLTTDTDYLLNASGGQPLVKSFTFWKNYMFVSLNWMDPGSQSVIQSYSGTGPFTLLQEFVIPNGNDCPIDIKVVEKTLVVLNTSTDGTADDEIVAIDVSDPSNMMICNRFTLAGNRSYFQIASPGFEVHPTAPLLYSATALATNTTSATGYQISALKVLPTRAVSLEGTETMDATTNRYGDITFFFADGLRPMYRNGALTLYVRNNGQMRIGQFYVNKYDSTDVQLVSNTLLNSVEYFARYSIFPSGDYLAGRQGRVDRLPTQREVHLNTKPMVLPGYVASVTEPANTMFRNQTDSPTFNDGDLVKITSNVQFISNLAELNIPEIVTDNVIIFTPARDMLVRVSVRMLGSVADSSAVMLLQFDITGTDMTKRFTADANIRFIDFTQILRLPAGTPFGMRIFVSPATFTVTDSISGQTFSIEFLRFL